MTKKIKILLVDDHPLVREGLANLVGQQPDFEICGEANNEPQALELIGTIHPDVAIAIDVNHTNDNPDAIDGKFNADVALGKGPVLAKGANVNPVLLELLVDTARAHKIPVQIEPRPMPTYTDANPLQVTHGGTAAALVGIPNRYMHAPTELVSLDDVEWAIELLAALIPRIGADADFRPLKP